MIRQVDTNNPAQYNVALCPPREAVLQFRELKAELKQVIGWYSACNADAHLTFDMFILTSARLTQLEDDLEKFAALVKEGACTFSGFGFFEESHTIYAKPDDDTERLIKQWFDAYTQCRTLPDGLMKIAPHITVGKGIKPVLWGRAKSLFIDKQFVTSFICSDIAIRKFNISRRQYDLYKRFAFGG